MPHKDPVKRAEYAAKYRASRREEARERTRRWVEANKQRSLESNRKYYLEHREERIAQIREYSKTEAGQLTRRRSWLKTVKNDPEAYHAQNLFKAAVRRGKISRQGCSVCGDINAQGHHEDYSKPYEVIWFCDYHHKLHEGKIVVPRADLGSKRVEDQNPLSPS